MNHEQAAPLISDWARGSLDAERSAAVERHVHECSVCREAAEGGRALVAETERAARHANGHPSSDALARFVTAPDDEPISDLARVGVHLRSCEPCRDDVSLMREASAPAWWAPLRAWWAPSPTWPRVLQPALALLAVVLLFPAWNGLVVAPRERATSEHRVRDAEDARARAEAEARELATRAGAQPRGGGMGTLVLHGGTRSVEAPPALRIRDGQILQPLLLDVVPPAGPMSARIVREGGAVAWTASGPREEFFDEANRLVGLLVPTAALEPGNYRVELAPGSGRPFFTSRFRILPSR
jgi:hypothetical protein